MFLKETLAEIRLPSIFVRKRPFVKAYEIPWIFA